MNTEQTLPMLDLTQDLKSLVSLAAREDAINDLLRRGLDWVARLAPYDLATVFQLEGNRLVVRAARGRLVSSRVRDHAIRLEDFPSLQAALEMRRARAFTEDDHAHGDGDPFDGVLDLPPGHACMVVPLCAGDRCFGIMSLDRVQCEVYPEPVVNLVEVFGQILALAIQKEEQKVALERLHEHEHARARLLEEQLGGGTTAVLDQSRSAVMRELARRAHQVARTDTPVLIQGETGTGKERLARAIHDWSRRAGRPLVTINCAAIPENLIESELFGHVKGAFTGAARERAGRFQMANGGTLLLDEIGELPLELQAKLLRVLQEGTLEPVGSDRTVKVDVRILAATHVDLKKATAERRFREDLYYRLSVFPLTLPPLRDRLEDLPQLCEVLLTDQARRTGRYGMRVTLEGLSKLAFYHWPGNIRELANVLERATILCPGRELGPDVLDVPGRPVQEVSPLEAPGTDSPELVTLEELERQHIRRVIAWTKGRIYGENGAARILGLKPTTLQSRMKKLGIDRAEGDIRDAGERGLNAGRTG